jgi:uncharacterized protein
MGKPTRPGRGLVRWLLVVALGIGVFVGMLWAFQRQLIYSPDPTPVPSAGDVIAGARDVILHTDDGLELAAWFVPAPLPERPGGMAVLYAPGNGGNRLGRADFARELRRRGFAVLLMDYRGYGGNPGSPSEDGLAADALAAVEGLDELGYPPERTIYFGESLGTGVVAALQEQRPPAGMVLRSPFTELADVGVHHYPMLPVRLLLSDRFPVLEPVKTSSVPLTVVYGDQDSVVPTRLSARVADGAASLVEALVLKGADHNDAVMFGPRVADPRPSASEYGHARPARHGRVAAGRSLARPAREPLLGLELLGRQRAGVRKADVHPAPELVVDSECLLVHVQPAIHLSTTHLEPAHVRMARQGRCLVGVDAQQ